MSSYFERHAPLARIMIVPIFENDRIVAVAGVGNKVEEYNPSDARQLTLLMDGMWKIIQREKAEKDLREKWEAELTAAVEAEYRRRRADVLLLMQWWLRDVWLHTLAAGEPLLHLPQIAGAEEVARRLTPAQAGENLRVLEQTLRLLHTNVQEALALEVGLLKLQL